MRPNTDPCGTPQVMPNQFTSHLSDTISFLFITFINTSTACFLLSVQLLIALINAINVIDEDLFDLNPYYLKTFYFILLNEII